MRSLAAAGLALVLVSVSSLPAGADEVVLKGGRRLTGVVVEVNARTVVLEVGPGRIGIPMTQVERIVTGASALAEYRARASRLAMADVAGWLELASWARDHGLGTQARTAFEHVLSLDPASPDAHRGLGHVRVAGGWGTLEESYRAQGLVSFEGRWVTPDERAAELTARQAELAANHAQAEGEARVREAQARAEAAEADARRAAIEADRAAAEASAPVGFGGFGGGTVFPPFVGAPGVVGGQAVVTVPPTSTTGCVSGCGDPSSPAPRHHRDGARRRETPPDPAPPAPPRPEAGGFASGWR